ncbi:MAG: hypothetical protein KAH23_03815 [Kiritimatiellae bacterium]|nr:hypothetical protein [Kiritimatiellia bacterium]
MRKLAYFVCVSSLIIATATLTGITGCEDDDDDITSTTELSISPSAKTLDASKTNSITFTASGGASNYSWSVKDSSLGALSDSDDTAIYTSTTNIGVNYVTVTDDSNDVVTATITQE